jgi:cation diffusion facilitator CzcD-associated flavoprotein CzcO
VSERGTQAGERHKIVIIGSGFSGIGMAIALKKAGVSDFVVLEKHADLGGTWRDNQYPGCACDVPSPLYSFSFELNPSWTELFSPQPEIWEYLRRCSAKYRVTGHMRYGRTVESVEWDDAARLWTVRTTLGDRYVANAVVSGAGALHIPSMPKIPGIESFGGTSFHSSAWDKSASLAGKRVAVIGTGASSIQIVPEVAERPLRSPSSSARRRGSTRARTGPSPRAPARPSPRCRARRARSATPSTGCSSRGPWASPLTPG